MMLPTDSLAELDDILKKNTTYCFKITAGKTGWCATCRVKLSIYFQLHHLPLFTSRPKLKKDNQVFVNRQKMALRDQITQMKWRLLPHLRWQILMPYIDKIIIWKGWGFCHQSCIREDHLKNDLQMVKLTTLSDNFCKVRVPVKVEKNVFKNTKEMQKKSPMRPHFFYFDRLPYEYFF